MAAGHRAFPGFPSNQKKQEKPILLWRAREDAAGNLQDEVRAWLLPSKGRIRTEGSKRAGVRLRFERCKGARCGPAAAAPGGLRGGGSGWWSSCAPSGLRAGAGAVMEGGGGAIAEEGTDIPPGRQEAELRRRARRRRTPNSSSRHCRTHVREIVARDQEAQERNGSSAELP